MSQFLTINNDELVPLSTVKRIRPVTADDREGLRKLGNRVDADRFNARIEFADGRRNYITETVDDIRNQTNLLQITDDAYVISANVTKARDLTEADITKMSERMGRPLSGDFTAQVDTTAGRVLSTVPALELMNGLN